MDARGPIADIIGLNLMDGKYIGDEGRNKGKQFCRHFNHAQTAFPSAKRMSRAQTVNPTLRC